MAVSAATIRFFVSIDRQCPGEKLLTGDERWGGFNGSFKPESHTMDSLLNEVMSGHAFCPELRTDDCGLLHHGGRWCCKDKPSSEHCGRPDGYRHLPHFKSVQHLALDGDGGTREIGWEKRTPKSDNIERRRCQYERCPSRKIHEGFRQGAVKLVTEERLSLPEAARRLSLAPSTLGYWVKAQRAGKLGDVGKTYRPLTEVEMDLARTKKELAEVKMERDILKKAAAYFAKESLPGTRR